MPETKRIPGPCQPRIPVVLLMDASASTRCCSERLRAAGKAFVTHLQQDETLRESVDLLIVPFREFVDQSLTFRRADALDPDTAFEFEPDGCTDPGLAILFALGRVKRWKDARKDEKKPYREPIMYMLTDGVPDAGENATEEEIREVAENYARAAACIRESETEHTLTFVGVGFGNADLATIRKLTSANYVAMMGARPLESFFDLVYDGTRTGTPWPDMLDPEEYI